MNTINRGNGYRFFVSLSTSIILGKSCNFELKGYSDRNVVLEQLIMNATEPQMLYLAMIRIRHETFTPGPGYSDAHMLWNSGEGIDVNLFDLKPTDEILIVGRYGGYVPIGRRDGEEIMVTATFIGHETPEARKELQNQRYEIVDLPPIYVNIDSFIYLRDNPQENNVSTFELVLDDQHNFKFLPATHFGKVDDHLIIYVSKKGLDGEDVATYRLTKDENHTIEYISNCKWEYSENG